MPVFQVSGTYVRLAMVGSGELTRGIRRPRGQLIALIISIGVRRAGPINLAFEFFLTSVAAELRFFLKKQPILAPEEISGGKTGEASSHDNDIGFAGGARVFERMPVANLVADFEVFTVNERRRWRFPIRRGQKRSVDRSATEPATTNLMNSRRDGVTEPPRVFREIPGHRRRGRGYARGTR